MSSQSTEQSTEEETIDLVTPEVIPNIEITFEEAIEWLDKKKIFFPIPCDEGEDSNRFTSVPVLSAVALEQIKLCTVLVPKYTDYQMRFTEFPKKFDNTYRGELLLRMAAELEANTETFCQLEALIRGILPEDTKMHGMPVLVDYLRYYSCLAHSTFAVKKDLLNRVEIILNENPISVFGMAIGRSLAAGIPLKIITVPTLLPVATLILELSVSMGLESGMVNVVPISPPSPKQVRFLKDTYVIHRSSDYPMIVFEDADVAAACNSVVHAAWGYAGKAHFRLKTVLVQATIFDFFVEILKSTVAKIKYGYADSNENQISFAGNDDKYVVIEQYIVDAKPKGIEVIQTNEDDLEFSPTVIIDSRVYSKDKVAEEESTGNIVFVLLFKDLNDAVDMAHYEEPSCATSIWTENTETAYKTALKLKVSNIWINSHGMILAELPYVHKHKSKLHFIGGKEGILQRCKNLPMDTDYHVAKQQRWNAIPMEEKFRIICRFISYMEGRNFRFPPCKFRDTFLNDVRNTLNPSSFEGKSKRHKEYIVTALKVPRGLICSAETTNIVLGLLHGNAVLYKPHSNYLHELATHLPERVLQRRISSHIKHEPLYYSKLDYDEDCIYTLYKNIWVKCP